MRGAALPKIYKQQTSKLLASAYALLSHARVAKCAASGGYREAVSLFESTDHHTNDTPTSHKHSTPTAIKKLQGDKLAILKAEYHASHAINEGSRPLEEYMALPASQYSVLDAKRIERLDDPDTFKCYVGGVHFFSFHVEPVITVSVTVQERGPIVKLLSTELTGSKTALEANEKFTATMVNAVHWRETDNGSGSASEIVSDVEICVTLDVPRWFVVPTRAIEKSGSAVLKRLLKLAVPRFLAQLDADYQIWADGDESRKPVGEIM
jgi:hypothetical protein